MPAGQQLAPPMSVRSPPPPPPTSSYQYQEQPPPPSFGGGGMSALEGGGLVMDELGTVTRRIATLKLEKGILAEQGPGDREADDRLDEVEDELGELQVCTHQPDQRLQSCCLLDSTPKPHQPAELLPPRRTPHPHTAMPTAPCDSVSGLHFTLPIAQSPLTHRPLRALQHALEQLLGQADEMMADPLDDGGYQPPPPPPPLSSASSFSARRVTSRVRWPRPSTSACAAHLLCREWIACGNNLLRCSLTVFHCWPGHFNHLEEPAAGEQSHQPARQAKPKPIAPPPHQFCPWFAHGLPARQRIAPPPQWPSPSLPARLQTREDAWARAHSAAYGR